jgi:hypothetical protein
VTTVVNGASSTIRVDGRYAVSGSVGAQADTQWTVFQFGGEQWYGWVGEIVAYARLVTASEIQLTEAYLTRKWGIA